MGGEQIIFPREFVVIANALAVFRSRLFEPFLGGRERGQRAVHVVAGAAEEPVGVLGPNLDASAAALKVFDRLRHEERHTNLVSGGRRIVGESIRVFRVVLQVEQLRVSARDVLERRMLRHILADNRTVYDEVRSHRVELVEVLLAGTCAHY